MFTFPKLYFPRKKFNYGLLVNGTESDKRIKFVARKMTVGVSLKLMFMSIFSYSVCHGGKESGGLFLLRKKGR